LPKSGTARKKFPPAAGFLKGGPMSEKRTRFLGIRVTDEEHAALLGRSEGRQLATWMRQVCLDARPPRARKLPSVDPALLRQLASMGNNLNQIARKVNAGSLAAGDRVQIVAALAAIDRGLEQLRHAVISGREQDDR